MHILHNTFLFCEYATEEHSSKSNNIVIRSVQYNMLLLLTFSNILLSICMCEREYTFYRFTLTLFGEYKMYLYVQNSGCVRYREIGGMEWNGGEATDSDFAERRQWCVTVVGKKGCYKYA